MSFLEWLPLFAALGCLAGLLSGTLGLGGGVVIVPALLMVFRWLGLDAELRVQMAVATSLACITVNSASAVYTHHQAGMLRWTLARQLALGVALGAFVGAFLADWLPGKLQVGLFGLFAMVLAVRMVWPRKAAASPGAKLLPGRAGLAGVGGGIGVVSSLFGIGGGSLTVPFLRRRRLDMREAVAVSASQGFVIALAGGLGYVLAGWHQPGLPPATLGYIHGPAFAGIVLTGFPMARVGARLAHRLPAARLQKVFAVVLFGIGLNLVLNNL